MSTSQGWSAPGRESEVHHSEASEVKSGSENNDEESSSQSATLTHEWTTKLVVSTSPTAEEMDWIVKTANDHWATITDSSQDEGLGDILEGRFSEVDDDPVETVREMRKP